MGATAKALPSFEVAVRCRGASLTGFQLVGIHRETHRAAWLAPVEAGRFEDPVEALGFGLQFHKARSGHYHGVDARSHPLACDHARHGPQIFDAPVRAGSDEYAIYGYVGNFLA